MSAESPHHTLQLLTIECPRRTVFVQITFKIISSWPNESKYSPRRSFAEMHIQCRPGSSAGSVLTVSTRWGFAGNVSVLNTPSVFPTHATLHAIDFFGVHTPKSKTTFLSRSILFPCILRHISPTIFSFFVSKILCGKVVSLHSPQFNNVSALLFWRPQVVSSFCPRCCLRSFVYTPTCKLACTTVITCPPRPLHVCHRESCHASPILLCLVFVAIIIIVVVYS